MTTPVDDYELEKVKNKFEAVQTFGHINYQRVAYKIAWLELIDKAELINEETARYRAVDATSLMRVAQEMFRLENASVLYYRKS